MPRGSGLQDQAQAHLEAPCRRTPVPPPLPGMLWELTCSVCVCARVPQSIKELKLHSSTMLEGKPCLGKKAPCKPFFIVA